MRGNNDWLDYLDTHNHDTLTHSAKGTTWAKHKYLKKIGNRYIYAEQDLRKKTTGLTYTENSNSNKMRLARTSRKKNITNDSKGISRGNPKNQMLVRYYISKKTDSGSTIDSYTPANPGSTTFSRKSDYEKAKAEDRARTARRSHEVSSVAEKSNEKQLLQRGAQEIDKIFQSERRQHARK